MASLAEHPQEQPQPRFRWWLIPVGVALLLGGLWSLRYLPGLLPWPDISLPTAAPLEDRADQLPDAYTRPTQRYGEIEPRSVPVPVEPSVAAPTPPMAQYVQRNVPTDAAREARQARLETQQAQVLASLTDLMQKLPLIGASQPAAPPAREAVKEPTGQAGQGKKVERSEKKDWAYLAKGKGKSQQVAGKEEEEVLKQAVGKGGEANDLIKPAKWARPMDPTKVLYASQVLPGVTETAMDSSIPGRVIIRVPIPVFDKVFRENVLLPKNTLIVAAQETQEVRFGMRRIALSIKQFEFPSGEVWAVKSTVGDGDGKQGLTGTVQNHFGQLIGATIINAVLSLGSNSLAGTPRGFYANPAQQSARDASQSISQDVNGIVREQLKVPPTIVIPSQTICSIYLEDNISFSRQPIVIR